MVCPGLRATATYWLTQSIMSHYVSHSSSLMKHDLPPRWWIKMWPVIHQGNTTNFIQNSYSNQCCILCYWGNWDLMERQFGKKVALGRKFPSNSWFLKVFSTGLQSRITERREGRLSEISHLPGSRSQELHPGLSHGCQERKYLDHYLLPLIGISKKLVWKWSS